MSQTQKFQWKHMTLGTCYYPEQWDESLWESDLDRMRRAGITTVRVAEFAWSIFEPRDGEFSFDLFDRFLALAHEKGIGVIFGTPTATPPAWLTEEHPEVLNARKDGVLYRHGGRRHYNYNAAEYQFFVSRLVEQLGAHYGRHPAIVGWQIDNELNCEVCDFFSEADDAEFRVYLLKTYGNLSALNDAWGTAFWNQQYTDWEQVHLPRTLPGPLENPHQQLDYIRFISRSVLSFVKLQTEILRKHVPETVFITTNGRFGRMDNHALQRALLDVYTYDSYPSFSLTEEHWPPAPGSLLDRQASLALTETRSICPHFGIMEQQAGACGGTYAFGGAQPRPGQITLWATQSVAHGADYISFFRWRTAARGTELYWHGILNYDNRDNRRLAEVTAFGDRLSALEPVCGSEYVASFALLKDYDNEWDADAERLHGRIAAESEQEIFAAAQLSHTPFNIVYLDESTTAEELAAYPLLIYPHPVIATGARTELLHAYVSRGGTLLLGCRSGYKDTHGRAVMLPQPGLFQPLTGTDVRDFTACGPDREPGWADWDGERLDAPLYNDVLTPLAGTRVLARYGVGYYAGEAALTEHPVGLGRVLHFGAVFSRAAVKRFLAYTGVLNPFGGLVDVPEEAELALRRSREGGEYLFLLNYQPRALSYTLKQTAHSLFSRETLAPGTYTLPPYGTECLQVR